MVFGKLPVTEYLFPDADLWIIGINATLLILQENIIKAQVQQTNYAAGNDMNFGVGNKERLTIRIVYISRPSPNVNFK